MIRGLLLCVALILGANGAEALSPAVVQVDSGRVQGTEVDGVIVFKGIPYVAPPVGPLRWSPPAPVAAWTGVKDATAFGPACPQRPGLAVPEGVRQSEDCLTLNVWAPAAAGAALPVMVWIHGGGDDAGTAGQAQFDGSAFARDGVVFVSVDYRLGALGWFAHPAVTAAATANAPLANYGLMDQIAALRWVKRNIRAFGGDPGRVTVAGESAGGEAVLFLLTVPAARGLFAQAIVESGAGWSHHPSLAEAQAQGATLAIRAGAPPGASAAALRALPASALIGADRGENTPAIDGRLVKTDPDRAFAARRFAPVPLLIGSNSGEDNILGQSDPAWVLKEIAPAPLSALRAAYGAETPNDGALARAIFRDNYVGAPARWIAARQSALAPSYLYQFAFVPAIRRLRTDKASHGIEMLFVFESLDRAPVPLRLITQVDRDEATMAHGCWVAFIKTGAPSCPGEPPWPAYTPAEDRLMLFGDKTEVSQHFRAKVYDILDGLHDASLTPAKSAP